MQLEKKVLILSAKIINFEQNGQKVEGCQVYFCDTETQHSDNFVGCAVAKAWLDSTDFEAFRKVKSFPVSGKVFYSIDLAKGRLKPVGFDIQ